MDHHGFELDIAQQLFLMLAELLQVLQKFSVFLCQILRYCPNPKPAHEQNQFTIQSAICLWTKITDVASMKSFPLAFDKGMPQQASPPLCPGAWWEFLEQTLSIEFYLQVECTAPERLKSFWYFVVEYSESSIRYSVSLLKYTHLFHNSVQQCLCRFEQHGHQKASTECKRERDS